MYRCLALLLRLRKADQTGTVVSCSALLLFSLSLEESTLKFANNTIGSEWACEPKTLQSLYGTVANYRRLAGRAIDTQIRAGFLLLEDAEILRRETVENVSF